MWPPDKEHRIYKVHPSHYWDYSSMYKKTKKDKKLWQFVYTSRRYISGQDWHEQKLWEIRTSNEESVADHSKRMNKEDRESNNLSLLTGLIECEMSKQYNRSALISNPTLCWQAFVQSLTEEQLCTEMLCTGGSLEMAKRFLPPPQKKTALRPKRLAGARAGTASLITEKRGAARGHHVRRRRISSKKRFTTGRPWKLWQSRTRICS